MRKPTRTPRPVSARDLDEIRRAIVCLKDARSLLRCAKASAAADYVARCLKSAQGAERHAERLLSRHDQ